MGESTLLWLAMGSVVVVIVIGLRLVFNRWNPKIETCPRCDGRIPKKALRCPHCGWDQPHIQLPM